MKLIEAVTQAVSRNDQLKANFGTAIDQVIKRYSKDFGDKGAKVKARLLSLPDVTNVTKNQIEATLKAMDIGEVGTITAREIAQSILTAVMKMG